MSNCKYYKQKKQISYDSGQTWSDVSPAEYQVGDLYQIDSPDCSEIGIIRWVVVPGDFLCNGKDKYVKEIEQYSLDGVVWRNMYPTTYRTGALIETNSSLCNNKWEGHYVDDTTPGVEHNCPMGSRWFDGFGCIYADPVKIIRCSTSSSTTLTTSETVYSPYKLVYGIIGDCVTEIGNNAFWGYGHSDFTDITIGSGVTTIGYQAFGYCGLTSVTFNDNSQLEYIGDWAFYSCSALTSIDIPDSVTYIGDRAFQGCSALTSIDIPDSVTYIGDYAFTNTDSLTSVTLGSGITSINYGAFQGCSGLTSLIIPDSVTSIGNSAFRYCSGLTSCTIGSGITSIDIFAFESCSGLASITVNADVPPSLGAAAFDGTNNCPIYVPCDSVVAYKRTSGWTVYADRIEGIPPCVGPYKLQATYNSGGTTVEHNVNCDSGTTLTTGDTKPSGYEYSAMTSAVIGDCVTSIGSETFYNCSGLTSCTIGSGVTTIGFWAFRNCTGLSSVTVNATTPPTLGSNVFYSTNENLVIYVPAGSVDTYKAASRWSDYASRIQAIPTQ